MITFDFVIETLCFKITFYFYPFSWSPRLGCEIYNKNGGYYLNYPNFNYTEHWQWIQNAYKSNTDHIYRKRWDLINKTGCSIDESISKILF